MPNYVVQADVVDITTDMPKASDAFWVDTNVLYWMSYSRASQRHPNSKPRSYQVQAYPRYVQQALRAGSPLHWIGLSLSELARLIEDAEREIAEGLGQIQPRIGAKSFRHDYPALRQQVVQEVRSCWQSINQAVHSLPGDIAIDEAAVNAALASMSSSALDAYDIFAVKAIQEAGIANVLTDDGDFCTVSGITLFTANRGVLSAAAAQGKLKTR